MAKRRRILLSIVLFAGVVLGAMALPQTLQVPCQERAIAQQKVDPIERFRNLGQQIARLRVEVPTVDRVVLVPDPETFLVAISAWSLQGRWPILIEDDRYAPLFLKRFAPAQTLRLPSVRTDGDRPSAAEMRAAIAAAWNAADPASLGQRWQQLGWQPPGVVATATDDPAWPAALALAADRGQPLVFLDGDYGTPNGTLTPSQWQRLNQEVERAVARAGYDYAGFGDAIDTLTLARSLPVKYQSPTDPRDTLAVTDGLGRQPDGQRWAIAGWIYGSSARSVYQAMCGIFLDTRQVLFYDSYPPEGIWQQYQMQTAAELTRRLGLKADLVQHPEASVATWQAIAGEPWPYDWAFINSRGSENRFEAGDGVARVEDVPLLQAPTAIYFIHSWSATAPANPATLAGRWLENGAYLYVGSVHEPYLRAFLPPETVTQRLFAQLPFLAAARQFASEPWKIATIGDPLATALPALPRRAPEAYEIP